MDYPRNQSLIFVFVFYILFQVFRFVALVMFAIFMIDCSVYHNETSVDCNINFTVYSTPGCGPYCWKGVWVGCSVITCLTWLFVLCVQPASRYVRRIRPASNAEILRSLISKPYFWSLNMIVLVVVVYDAIILSQKHVSGSEEVEMGVIISKLLTASLIFQLNFTYPPRPADNFSYISIISYYITLSIFVLDNVCKFAELSIRISYKLYTVTFTEKCREAKVVGLMLEVVDATLYHSFATFFWNKIFRGRSDVLMTYSPDLTQSLCGQRDTTGEDLGPASRQTSLSQHRDAPSRLIPDRRLSV